MFYRPDNNKKLSPASPRVHKKIALSFANAIAKLSKRKKTINKLKVHDLFALLSCQIKRNKRRAFPVSKIHLRIGMAKNSYPIKMLQKKAANN
ncbi:MAG: hypothetical protein QWI73_02495 [Alphaproteobacteria bacterium]|nr:hypothetical protein [Alphaproteobacteria bacterium]